MNSKINLQPGKQTENWFQADSDEHDRLPYLLFVPTDYETKSPLPLLLFLHGFGECGRGNFDLIKTHGPPKVVDEHPDFPFVTVSPQCPTCDETMDEIITNWDATILLQLIDHLIENTAVDPKRLYLTGLSMGGFGAWRLAAAAPAKFAALLPICGGGNAEWANRLVNLPTWAFHGALDDVVGLFEYGKPMVDALQLAGGDVKLTIYPNLGHDSWTQTYENQQIYDWLLRQRLP